MNTNYSVSQCKGDLEMTRNENTCKKRYLLSLENIPIQINNQETREIKQSDQGHIVIS